MTVLRAGWKRWLVISAGLGLSTVSTLLLPGLADAGMVSGHVSDEKGKAQSGVTFKVKVAADKIVDVKTDQGGNYRVFLAPGIYTVEFPDGRQAEILSHPEPIKQDIRLKSK